MKYKLVSLFIISLLLSVVLPVFASKNTLLTSNDVSTYINQELSIYPLSKVEKFISYNHLDDFFAIKNKIETIQLDEANQIIIDFEYPIYTEDINFKLYDNKHKFLSDLPISKHEVNQFYLNYYQNLNNKENYIISAEYNNLVFEKEFSNTVEPEYWVSNYEILDENIIKVNFNKPFKKIGYLFPSNFKGYIINQTTNSIFIKLEETLDSNKAYNFILKYSVSSDDKPIDSLYGSFTYAKKNEPLKIENIKVLSNSKIKITFNQQALIDNLNYKNNILIINKQNQRASIQSVSAISNNEIIIELSKALSEGIYSLTIEGIKDYNQKNYNFNNISFTINTFETVRNIFIEQIKSDKSSTVSLTFNQSIADISDLKDVHNYQIKSLDNYSSQYKVTKIDMISDNQLLLHTNILNQNENVLLFIDKIEKDINSTFSHRSYTYLSGENEYQITNLNIKNISKNEVFPQDGLYIQVNIQGNINKAYEETKLYIDNKEIKRNYYIDSENLYYRLLKEDAGKSITVLLNDYKKTMIIPKSIAVEGLGYISNDKKYIQLSFSESLNFDLLSKLKVLSDNKEIDFSIIKPTVENEYVSSLVITVPTDIKKAVISIPQNIQQSITNFENRVYENINIKITDFKTFDVVKSMTILNKNTIRVQLNDDVIFNSNTIDITDLNNKTIINDYNIEKHENYFDIIFKNNLEQKYQVSFISESFSHPLFGILHQSINFNIDGVDLEAFITPYINNEWSQIDDVSEILIGIEVDKSYYVYGENNSVEVNSVIQLYSNKNELIGSTESLEDGFFPKIKIPLEYLVDDTFKLQCIDSYGNVSEVKIVISTGN